MVVIGLDWGESRIGVAVSDELEVAAHPGPTIERDGEELERIAELVRQRGAQKVVLGLPVRMDGTEGTQARKVRGFLKELKKVLPQTEMELVDERLSSAQAHRALSQMGAGMRQRRERVDRMAAQIILQRYLGRRSPNGGEPP
jgi:putative Holliday junction resolvase